MATVEGGFPHSEIHGSKPVRGSPWLIAAYHVLHRLSAPRHPPDTLKTLDRSHYRCPSRPRPKGAASTAPTFRHRRRRCHKDLCFRTCPGWEAVKAPIVMPRVPGAHSGTSHDAPRRTPKARGGVDPSVRSARQAAPVVRPQSRSAGHIHSSRCRTTRPVSTGRCASRRGRWRILVWRTRGALRGRPDQTVPARATAEAMVEQDGIEPTTSCLQSTRSPN